MPYKTHPLDGSLERVRRAEKHFATLKLEIAAALKRQEDAIEIQFDPNPPHKLRLLPPTETYMSMSVGILIGEICYNLRAAMDYLAFALAKHDSGTAQDLTQFLIEDTKKSFEFRVKQGRLKGINAAHIAAIERLQPYNGTNWTKTLRDLSNPDKHRDFVQIMGGFKAIGYSRLEDANFDAIQAPIRQAPFHPVQRAVDVKVHYSGRIEFPGAGPVIQTLEKLILNVGQALEAFKPEF